MIIELYHPSKADIIQPGDPWKPGEYDKARSITYLHDGMKTTVDAGAAVKIRSGESVTLMPMIYHTFYAEKGHGAVMIGEVSRVNDDNLDNRFFYKVPRFPPVDEDEPPKWIRCNEYTQVLKFKTKPKPSGGKKK